MKRTPRQTPLVVVTLLIVAALAFLLTRSELRKMSAPSPVATTVFPLYDITKNIVGTSVPVTVILPPGANPHTFEQTPSEARAIAGAQVVYAIGYGIDDWVDTIRPRRTQKLVVNKNIVLRAPAPNSDDTGTDPHYWLTVPNAKIIATNIATDLEKRFPQNAPLFRTNLAQYLQKLSDADAEIRLNLSLVKNKNLVTLHDAWYYFSAEYGLSIIGSFEPSAGKEPTPRYLRDLSQDIAKAKTRVLYTEPFIATDMLKPFLRDNALRIATLDPIEGLAANDSYISLMKKNAQTIRNNQDK